MINIYDSIKTIAAIIALLVGIIALVYEIWKWVSLAGAVKE